MRKLLLLLCLLLPLCALADEGPFNQEMIERSLVSVGNTERLHRAIDKAARGEEVTIVYLGGSITEGAGAQPQLTRCYAYLSAQHFASRFMQEKSQLKYVNAGIGGTPSLLGLTRSEKDVISREPDIVFVEYAVNDANDAVSRTVYEALIRRLLNSGSQPAVILLFTLTDTGYSCQAAMQAIGRRYDLGMVSVKDAIQPALRDGSLKWADYSSDFAHPTNQGHAFVAALIDHYFAKASQAASERYAVAEGTKAVCDWERLRNIQPEDPEIETTGSFKLASTMCYTYRRGWLHRVNAGAEPMVLRVSGSKMTLAFKQENNANVGRVEVRVDGVLRTTLAGNSPTAWGNIVTEYIFLGTSGEHTVELRMKKGDEKKLFTLLDIGLIP